MRIGAIVSRSGAAVEYGERVARGFDLAVEEINARGGVDGRRLELVYRDDSTNGDMGLSAAKDLVETERIGVVLGPVSSTVMLRVAPYCERQRVLLLSPSASAPQITDAGEYIFRAYPSDVLEGASMAEFARDLGLDRVGILAVDNEYGSSLSRVFEGRFQDAGGTIALVRTFVEGDATSRSTAVQGMTASAPRGIYLAAYGGDVAAVLALLRSSGLRPLVLGTSAVTADIIRQAGTAAENAVFPSASFDSDAEDPAARRFVDAYRARYQDAPDVYAAHAYDAVQVLVEAARSAGTWRPDDLRKALLKIDNHDGASGRMAFDAHGDVLQYPRLFVVRGGRFVAYDRFVEAGGALPVSPR
ncbi:MAG TPA: ABC transporter substrate-binding protein [Candidatus Bathyarchaeia archaeon]|nr:ABC transporter substrate-binding protein [Candidatus Bathyarchaeia archaeon]